MFKQEYRAMNERIFASDSLKAKTADKINRRRRKEHSVLKRSLAAAAAVAVCVFVCVPALAANVPAFYDLLYKVSPAAAQFFLPVDRSFERDGIELSVSAVYARDDEIQVLLSLRDLESDRVDETIDLMDGYWIKCSGNSVLSDELVNYDESTRTATYLMTFKGSNIAGKKVTFGIDGFYRGFSSQSERPTGLKLGDYAADAETSEAGFLVPFDVPVYTIAEGFDISALGYADGKFTVQTHTASGTYGYVLIGGLLDGDGGVVDWEYSTGYRTPEGAPPREGDEYSEYIFDIPKDSIGDYSLSAGYVNIGERVAGPWRITFPLTEYKD